jgi:hypothetical protein
MTLNNYMGFWVFPARKIYSGIIGVSMQQMPTEWEQDVAEIYVNAR